MQSWGTQTIEPIAQLIVRPNETGIGRLPNEDAQSLIFDDSNLFKRQQILRLGPRRKAAARANVGIQYTAQFNRGGIVNVLFGQSYQLFGAELVRASAALTNTGLDSGLDTAASDYVARVAYQPTRFTFTSRFRFDESDFTCSAPSSRRRVNFGRWTTTLMYGNYAAQPETRAS